MSIFDLNQSLESINGGVHQFNLIQQWPNSGNITTGTSVGTNQCTGTTMFQFQDSVNWWSPSLSYFVLRLQFVKYTSGVAGVIPYTDNICYADNFACTLFNTIKTYINSQSVDTIDVPWIVDTALSYSNSQRNFLRTAASMSRLGEPLMTRIHNTCGNGGYVEVAFRPPACLFDCAILPPGPQFRVDFNWGLSSSRAFEYLNLGAPPSYGVGTTGYDILVSDFYFMRASMEPSHMINIPLKGVIDLSPCTSQQFNINNVSQLKQNLTPPATVNRILVVLQDANTTPSTNNATTGSINYTNTVFGVGTGYNPATSFAYAVSSGPAANSQPFVVPITQLYISLTELGIQMPNPLYSFDNNTGRDWLRAYSDWCHVTQGTSAQSKGSIPFGSYDVSQGISINYLNTTVLSGVANGLIQAGDPNNPQQYYLTGVGATNPASTSFNQTARYGWSGRCPGPIFAFPVVRPDNKSVTTGTVSILMASTPSVPVNAVLTVLYSYSMALVVESAGNGLYTYQLIDSA
jgi:hypothetical protein